MLSSKILKPMGYACCFLFILCFVAIIYYILSDDDHICKHQPIDLYVLAADVLPTYCLKSKCSRIKDSQNIWNIHGLWPSSYKSEVSFCCKGQSPKCCDNQHFNITALNPILSQLRSSWRSVKGPDELFWGHEWSKHGTCATRLQGASSQLNYFNMSLQLFQKLGIQSLLENANISPTNDPKVTISLQAFRHAIESKLNATIYILCQQMGPNFYGPPRYKDPNLVSGVRLCFDSNFKPINCRSSARGCKARVVYPSFGFSF